MDTDNDIALMKAYAVLGMNEWRHAGQEIKEKASRLLGKRLAQNDGQAEAAIKSLVRDEKRPYFIPMPQPRPDIAYSYFMPMSDEVGTSFDLLLHCRDDKWLGFRFEPADPKASSHNYGHIQMNRRMEGGGSIAVPGAPDWLPTSYPAFPLRSSDPVEMFLSMITSVHGYPKFISKILDRAQLSPRLRLNYKNLLSRMMI